MHVGFVAEQQSSGLQNLTTDDGIGLIELNQVDIASQSLGELVCEREFAFGRGRCLPENRKIDVTIFAESRGAGGA